MRVRNGAFSQPFSTLWPHHSLPLLHPPLPVALISPHAPSPYSPPLLLSFMTFSSVFLPITFAAACCLVEKHSYICDEKHIFYLSSILSDAVVSKYNKIFVIFLRVLAHTVLAPVVISIDCTERHDYRFKKEVNQMLFFVSVLFLFIFFYYKWRKRIKTVVSG